jgi:hypothetical protein
MGAKASKRKQTSLGPVPPGAGGPSSSSPASALWEWADDSQVFRGYDAAAIATLEAAFAAGQSSVTLTNGSHQYSVDLVGLQQTNVSTSFSRAIRRNAAFASSSPIPSTTVPLSGSSGSSGSSSPVCSPSFVSYDDGDGDGGSGDGGGTSSSLVLFPAGDEQLIES